MYGTGRAFRLRPTESDRPASWDRGPGWTEASFGLFSTGSASAVVLLGKNLLEEPPQSGDDNTPIRRGHFPELPNNRCLLDGRQFINPDDRGEPQSSLLPLRSQCRRWHRRARIAFRVGWPKTWPNLHLRFSLPGAIAGNQRSATPRSAASRATLWLSRISGPPCSWFQSIPAPAGCKPRNPRNQEYGARGQRRVIGRQAVVKGSEVGPRSPDGPCG